jgi:hypothetical protein
MFAGAVQNAIGATVPEENAQPRNNWLAERLTNPATNHEIEGFISVTSANPGDTVQFYINAAEAANAQLDI